MVEDVIRIRRRLAASDIPQKRIDENLIIGSWNIRSFSRLYEEWAENPHSPKRTLLVLGDFNIDKRGDNPLFQAFTETGLVVPPQLKDLKTTYATEPKYYDQIAWFMGNLDLLTEDRAGVIDFAGAVYKEISLRQMSCRVSDHFPIWVEFIIDRSQEEMAHTLGWIPPCLSSLFTFPIKLVQRPGVRKDPIL